MMMYRVTRKQQQKKRAIATLCLCLQSLLILKERGKIWEGTSKMLNFQKAHLAHRGPSTPQRG
jgi:hypothetical protein